ncbi:MAG: hypothetical protein QM756_45535 [Polyangiaceae bacterium]
MKSWLVSVAGLCFASAAVAQTASAPSGLEQALCGKTPACELSRRVGGLTTAQGERREVWRVTFPEEGGDTADDPACLTEQFWLVAFDAQAKLVEKRLFSEGCARESSKNSWCGMPPRTRVRVTGKVVEADWDLPVLRCAGAYHYDGAQRASLETFAPLWQRSHYYRILAPREDQRRTWDFTRMKGTSTLSGSGWSERCAPLFRAPAPRIPSLSVAPGFVSEGWRSLDMKQCSTRIDSTHGMALHGALARAALHLLRTREGVLFIDLTLAANVEATPAGALLRVCHSPGSGVSSAYCHGSAEALCADLDLNGSVVAGGLNVERAPDRLRFKVELPPEMRSIGVAYLESPKGRSIASSQLQAGDDTSFSDVFDVDPALATCEQRDGALRLKYEPVGD